MSAKVEAYGDVTFDLGAGSTSIPHEARWANPKDPKSAAVVVPHFASGLVTIASTNGGGALVMAIEDHGGRSIVRVARGASRNLDKGGYILLQPGGKVVVYPGRTERLRLENGGIVDIKNARPEFKGVGMRHIPPMLKGRNGS